MTQPWLILRSHTFPISLRLDSRVPSVLAILTIITIIGMILSISQGEYAIPPVEVVKSLLGLETTNSDYTFIIHTLRLPRTLVALLVGIGLAIAGTITQGITRNPLAAPEIIGVNSGAALAAVTLIVLLPNAPIFLLPFAAFCGAITVAILIYLLAWKGGSSLVRLILIGIGFNLIASALTNLMITIGDINTVSQALVWLAGSVYGRTWEQFFSLLPWIVIFSAIALILARNLDILMLGDDLACSLGLSVEWQRGLLLITSVALAGSSVATAGSIAFIGLIAPHLSKQLVGNSSQGLIPTAAIMGGMLVVLADLIGRTLFSPTELPCGIVTAAIGAPYFIYLLIRKQN